MVVFAIFVRRFGRFSKRSAKSFGNAFLCDLNFAVFNYSAKYSTQKFYLTYVYTCLGQGCFINFLNFVILEHSIKIFINLQSQILHPLCFLGFKFLKLMFFAKFKRFNILSIKSLYFIVLSSKFTEISERCYTKHSS